MDLKAQLRGGPELNKLLEAMPDRMANNVMRGGVRAGLAVIRDSARARVHVGKEPLPEGRKPGDLKRGIRIGSIKRLGDRVVGAVGIIRAVFWGRFVEFGTQARAAGRGRRAHHATRAYPFMRPAADESASAAAQAVIDYSSRRVVDAAIGAGVLPQQELDDGD